MSKRTEVEFEETYIDEDQDIGDEIYRYTKNVAKKQHFFLGCL